MKLDQAQGACKGSVVDPSNKKTRPRLSAPSKHPFDLLYKLNKLIKDLILGAAKRFVPMSAGFE